MTVRDRLDTRSSPSTRRGGRLPSLRSAGPPFTEGRPVMDVVWIAFIGSAWALAAYCAHGLYVLATEDTSPDGDAVQMMQEAIDFALWERQFEDVES